MQAAAMSEVQRAMARAAEDLRQRAIARLHGPVDAARAVWRGQVLVGHRSSIQNGEMFWALPGRKFADASALRNDDPAFAVIGQPSQGWLVDQQPVLKELMQ